MYYSRCNDIESPISHCPTLNQIHVKNRTHSVKLSVLGLVKSIDFVSISLLFVHLFHRVAVHQRISRTPRQRCMLSLNPTGQTT